MFHVELRQFPHQARAFNLTRSELDARIVGPWVSGAVVELDDRRWSPERARLTIYEGPELAGDQLGLGRGWANVTRLGQDVTERLLAAAAAAPAAAVVEFKSEVLDRCARVPLTLALVVELAAAHYPQARVSELLALCEQAVWELLHEGTLGLVRAGAPVVPDDWQGTLLSWEVWRGEDVVVARR